MKLQQSENQNVMLKYWEKFADGLDIAYCIKANVWRPVPKLCKYVGSSTSEQLKSIRFLLCLDIRYVNTVWNVKMRTMSEVKYVLVSMWDLDNKELAMNSSVAISLMSIKQEFKTVDINCALIVPLARFLTYFPFFYLGSFCS